MKLLPEFTFTILSGWIYFVFYLSIFAITMSTCSKEVRTRLYDRSLWDKKTKIITVIGKSFSLVNIVFINLGALQIGSIEFYIGTGFFLLGLGLLVGSILNYRNAPLDKPIINGIYKISRNPQMISLYLLFIGLLLVIGTWLGLIFLSVSIICSHFSILGEENSLKRQYGESYEQYLKQVPRYFLIF